MPTYTYECKSCGHEHDVFHGISAKPRVKCEECGAPCKRLLGTGSGIIFKGSGFYETDYKQKSGKPAESGEKKESSSKDTSSSESKGTKKESGSSSDSSKKAKTASKD